MAAPFPAPLPPPAIAPPAAPTAAPIAAPRAAFLSTSSVLLSTCSFAYWLQACMVDCEGYAGWAALFGCAVCGKGGGTPAEVVLVDCATRAGAGVDPPFSPAPGAGVNSTCAAGDSGCPVFESFPVIIKVAPTVAPTSSIPMV